MKRKKNWGSLILAATSAPIRLEILKLLDNAGSLQYTEIMFPLNLNPIRDAGKFVYHLRNLINVNLISLDKKTKKYKITELGTMMVKLARDIEDYIEVKKGRLLVRTSRSRIEEFNRNKIIDSLVKEAGIPIGMAQEIAFEAEDKLMKLKNLYLTAPLIREFINAMLIEKGLEEFRHRLTRLGMPLYDVVKLFTESRNIPMTITKVEKTIKSSVLSEYVLLKGIPRHVADAHLSGLIHINRIDNWVLKPDEIFHDFQYFLKNGSVGHKPPQNLKQLVTLLEKIYSQSKIEVSSSLTIDLFNVLIAPYVRGLDKKAVINTFKDLLERLSLDINDTSINFTLEESLPPFIKDLEVIGPQRSNLGTYQDYEKEVRFTTECFIEALKQIHMKTPILNIPISFKLRNVKTKIINLENVLELASETALPHFFVCEPDENVGFTPDGLKIGVDRIKDHMRGYLKSGNLGTVHLNIPRLHYESQGKEERFLQKLQLSTKIAMDALKSKRDGLKKVLKNNMLPFLAGNGNSNFLIDDAIGTISFVGLSEVVKARVGGSIYTKDGIKYVSKLLGTMKQILQEEESEYDMRFKLAQKPSGIGSGRLAYTDIEKFGKNIICAENITNLYYTDIPFIPLTANLPLRERIEIESSLQKVLPEGCFTFFTLKKTNIEKLINLNEFILEVGCKSYTYTKELSHCNRCQTLSHGFLSLCPKCGNNNLTHIGRASALLQPTYIWPEFKLKSSKNWKYHTL